MINLIFVNIKSCVMSFLDNSAAILLTSCLTQVTRSRITVRTLTLNITMHCHCDTHLRILLSLYTDPVNRPLLASIKYLAH